MRELTINAKEHGEIGREYTYRVLRENIMTLHLPPGSVLQETRIADMLSLSRTPVREALFKLRKEFLVEVYPQSGSVVSPIDLEILREGVFMRMQVESAIITRLFGNLNDVLIQQMRDNLGKQKALLHANDPEIAYEFLRLDDEFHRFTYLAGRKDSVYYACKSLSSQFDRVRHLIIMNGQMNQTTLYEEHKLLYMQLLSGMGEGLVEIYRGHLNAFERYLPSLLEKYPEYFEKSERRRNFEQKQLRAAHAAETVRPCI